MEASCCYVEVEFSDGDAEAADAKVTQAQHSSWNSKYHIYYYVLVVETQFCKYMYLKYTMKIKLQMYAVFYNK
jgi:hypothetical protein